MTDTRQTAQWDVQQTQPPGQGPLAELNTAGILTAADVHVARAMTRLANPAAEDSDEDEQVALAVALAVRAVREGSVCVDLDAEVASIAQTTPQIELPEMTDWMQSLAEHALVQHGILILDHGLLYLQRYHHQEVSIAESLRARAQQSQPDIDAALLSEGLGWAFPTDGYAEQRDAASLAIRSWTSVLTGGPGTGKTTAVAGILALLAQQHAGNLESDQDRPPPLRIALAAPTAKAASRLQEAFHSQLEDLQGRALAVSPELAPTLAQLRQVSAMTVHRLLGASGRNSGLRHHEQNRLPYDVIVVDEASMLPLTMTAALLSALRNQTRVIIVGDPDQLVSVEAGAVLADLVAGLTQSKLGIPVIRLMDSHRFSGDISLLASAIRDGNAEGALQIIAPPHPSQDRQQIELVDPEHAVGRLRSQLTQHAVELRRLALAGEEDRAIQLLGAQRVMCAHREGPWGVRHWNAQVERWLLDESTETHLDPMYLGRPMMVTRNDYGSGLFNGDTGVISLIDGEVAGAIALPGGTRAVPTSHLDSIETMHAITIHKAQGSQAEHAIVLMPDAEATLLSRELLYTAVTRAQTQVTLVASAEVIARAIEHQVRRASGLARRLAKAA